MAVIKNSFPTPIGGQGLGGKTRHSNATQVAIPAGAIASGDTMTVAHLPQNARLLDMIIKNDAGVSLTFALGVAGEAARFRTSAALANGAVARGVNDGAVFARTVLYPTTPVVATFGAGATVPAGAILSISMEYIVDEPFAI